MIIFSWQICLDEAKEALDILPLRVNCSPAPIKMTQYLN